MTVVDYNDPQFKNGLEVGLSCGLRSEVINVIGDEIIVILPYGYVEFPIDVEVLPIESFTPTVKYLPKKY